MIKLEGNDFATITYKDNLNFHVYRMPSNRKYRKHWHTQIEWIRCISNTFTIIADNTVYILDPGDIAFIIPGAIHELIAPSSGERTIYLAETEIIKKSLDLNTMLGLIPPILIISLKNDAPLNKMVISLLDLIEKEANEASYFFETMVYSLFIETLVIIGREFIRNPSHHNNNKFLHSEKRADIFLPICNYINQHCIEDLTLEQISSLAGFSKFHFTRLFREFTNTSFHKYLIGKRIVYAEQFLATSEFSISDIALRCGFSSPSTFSRIFRSVKGCTPKEFRALIANRNTTL